MLNSQRIEILQPTADRGSAAGCKGHLEARDRIQPPAARPCQTFNQTPSAADKVHCVCFVVPCGSASDESYMAWLCEMRDVVRTRGANMLFKT